MFKDSEAELFHQSSVKPVNLAQVSLVEDEAAELHALLTDLRQSSFSRLHLPFTAAYSASSGRKNLKPKMQRHSAAEPRSRSLVTSSKTFQSPSSVAFQGHAKPKAGYTNIFSAKSLNMTCIFIN